MVFDIFKSLIEKRNLKKLDTIESAAKVWETIFYHEWTERNQYWRLEKTVKFKKWVLDTISRIITKLKDTKDLEAIKWYQQRIQQIELLQKDYPGTVAWIHKFISLIIKWKFFTEEDLGRHSSSLLSNKSLHQVSDQRLVAAWKWLKALCFDITNWKANIVLNQNELKSAFEVMLLPYYYPDSKSQESKINHLTNIFYHLIANKVERKKRPSMDQIEQILTTEKLEWDILIYTQDIIQNKL